MAISDEKTATFEDLDMDSLDIVAFGYGLESELAGFNGDEPSWTVRTTIGTAIADVQRIYAGAQK